ncbi:MAG: ribonuclease H-like domain-containing protein [Magnetococcus sp. THC-1_WYH]
MNRLRDRLALIRGKTQATITPEATGITTPSLAQRLQRLRPSSPPARPSPRLSDEALAHHLGGQLEKPGLITVQKTLKPGFRYGHFPLAHHAQRFPPSLITDQELHLDKTLFLDTETTGLSGGSGTIPFLVGLGETSAAGFRVTLLLITGFSGEWGLLETLRQYTDNKRHVLTYNGKSFDLPLLASRHRLHRLANPLENLHALDLLYPVRRAFRRHWPDCKLGSVEAKLLGRPRKNDIPGADIPQVWTQWINSGRTERLAETLRHNAMDILAMAALLPALDQVYQFPAAHQADIHALATAMAQGGQTEQALQLLQGNLTALDDAGLLALATLYRQNNDWPRAVALWNKLAHRNHPEAMEALCKYYEHRLKDFAQALHWSQQRLRHPDHKPADGHRQQRLLKKMMTPSA